jgi:hypothetical protein
MHFTKADIPPIHPQGFWSLTIYDKEYFLVANSIKPLLVKLSRHVPKQPRWFNGLVHSEGVPWSGQAIQLAPRPQWGIHTDAELVLAEG